MTAGELAAAIRATAQRLPTEPNVPIEPAALGSIREAVRGHLAAVEPLEVEGRRRERVVRELHRTGTRLGGVPGAPMARLAQARKYLLNAAEALEG